MKTLENISQEQFERLERYAMSMMSQSERKHLETELASNPELSVQLDEVKSILTGIETAALIEKLNEFHGEISPLTSLDSPSVRPNRMLRWAVAAILVVAVGSLWMLNRESAAERLFATHFKPDPGLPTTMSSSSNFEFYDAMVNYKQGDYKTAIEKWEALTESTSQPSDTLSYFLAVAYLAEGNEEASILRLERLWDSNQNSFRDETSYYLGLAYLKVGNIENAVKYLTFSKAEGAGEVLSNLKN